MIYSDTLEDAEKYLVRLGYRKLPNNVWVNATHKATIDKDISGKWLTICVALPKRIVYKIKDLVDMHKRKSLTQLELVGKVATELHCILHDAGMTQNDARIAATVLRDKIIIDDWKE